VQHVLAEAPRQPRPDCVRNGLDLALCQGARREPRSSRLSQSFMSQSSLHGALVCRLCKALATHPRIRSSEPGLQPLHERTELALRGCRMLLLAAQG